MARPTPIVIPDIVDVLRVRVRYTHDCRYVITVVIATKRLSDTRVSVILTRR